MTQQLDDPIDWAAFRGKMPVTRRWAYLDHAAVSPLPGPTQEAIANWAADASANGDTSWLGWAERVEGVRQAFARLLGAQNEEIALLPNTTAGINCVAEGYPWQPGDNVVTFADEFPTNQYPWMHLASRDVEVRRIPSGDGVAALDRLAAACDRHTRIVAISWVGYASGWRTDLDAVVRIAHGVGALVSLDAIQGLGVFPLDVRRTPIDFLASDGHKWLLGPEGAGVFFIRREHLDRLRPIGVGWNSVRGASDFQHIELAFRDTAARYEGGSQNILGTLALGASLELLTAYDNWAIARRVLDVTDLACRRLAEIGAVVLSDRTGDRRSGIVLFEVPGRDPVELRRRCLQREVVLSCRGGRLRISPHVYNDASDIKRLTEALTDG